MAEADAGPRPASSTANGGENRVKHCGWVQSWAVFRGKHPKRRAEPGATRAVTRRKCLNFDEGDRGAEAQLLPKIREPSLISTTTTTTATAVVAATGVATANIGSAAITTVASTGWYVRGWLRQVVDKL